jgi:hypothetical protein
MRRLWLWLSILLGGCGYPDFDFAADAIPVEDVEVDTSVDVSLADSEPLEDSSSMDTTIVDSDPGDTDSPDTGSPDTGSVTVDTGTAKDTSVADSVVVDTAMDVPPETSPMTVKLIGTGSSWRYKDDGITPAAGWSTTAYDASSWKVGAAPLGYGYGSLQKTTVSYGPDGAAKYISTWFRLTFTVADKTKYDQLTVKIARDDGAVVWINGSEVARSNMPSGAITPTTPSATHIVGMDTTFHWYSSSTTPLKNGDNVIAVEVHQFDGASSDLFFDLELDARQP